MCASETHVLEDIFSGPGQAEVGLAGRNLPEFLSSLCLFWSLLSQQKMQEGRHQGECPSPLSVSDIRFPSSVLGHQPRCCSYSPPPRISMLACCSPEVLSVTAVSGVSYFCRAPSSHYSNLVGFIYFLIHKAWRKNTIVLESRSDVFSFIC